MLNPRQQRFVELYLSGLPASQAYRQAGYSVRTARSAESAAERLLRNVEVQAAVDRAAERQELTVDWVLGRLKAEAVDRGEGGSHSARVRALELLGKRLRLFPDQHELSGPGGGDIPITLAGLSDDQLRTLDGLLAAGQAGADPGGGPGGAGPAAPG